MAPRTRGLATLEIAHWLRTLTDETVPFIECNPRMGLPASFFLPGAPDHWLLVVGEQAQYSIPRFEEFCKTTQTDGYIAVGAPGARNLVPVLVTANATDRRRYAQILLNRGAA